MAVTNAEIFGAILSLREATDAFSQRTEWRFDRLEGRLGQVESRMGRLETRIEHVEKGQRTVEKGLAQREFRADLVELKRRFR